MSSETLVPTNSISSEAVADVCPARSVVGIMVILGGDLDVASSTNRFAAL